MRFGELLREIRNERGLSVNNLGKKSGVSGAHISRLENEQRSVPKPETIRKIANVLGYYEELMLAAGYIKKTPKKQEKVSISDIPSDIAELVTEPNNHILLQTIKEMLDDGYSNEVIVEWLKMLGPTMAEFGQKYKKPNTKPEILIYDPKKTLLQEEKEEYSQRQWINKNDFKKEK